MKPGKNDIPIKIKIEGRQLEELQKHTWGMSEAYGLDTRVGNYKGKKPISFYQWDLDCIDGLLDYVLNDEKLYPDKQDEGYVILHELYETLQQAYKTTYPVRRPPRVRTVSA